jgi:chemotaxis protein methyltransferase CheR
VGRIVLNITETDLAQLAFLLLDRAGLKVGQDGYYGLKLALSARMPALGIGDADEYVRRLKGVTGEHELRSLLPLVTVGHTEFFRDPRQFRAMEQRVLPDLLGAVRREGRRAQIWSAGCATGEEPYSLAMLMVELGASPAEVDIWATDLNPAAVESAQAGHFPPRRMAPLSEQRRRRFFSPAADGSDVKPFLKEWVRFEGLNLAAPVFAHVLPASKDLILCRNVIIYFDLDTIRGLMDRFLQALRPGGLLLLGYSESLFRVYDRFEMVEVEGAFGYRRPVGMRTASREVRAPVPIPPRATPLPMPARATPLPRPPPRSGEFPAVQAPPPVATPAKPTPGERLEAVARLVEAGDFEGALAAAQKLVEDDTNLNLHALLTLGNIYALMGRNPQAREAFGRVLANEPLCVEARVYGALAALQAGQMGEARAEVGKALFLEPTLALGHYLLAQVEERSGEKEAARRAYRNALAQLRFKQRPLAGFYPDLPDSPELITRAARYALAALEEQG